MVVPTAIKPTMAAATARKVSRALTLWPTTTFGAGRGAEAGAGREPAGAGAATGAAPARGAAAGGAAKVAVGAGAAVGPPGGKVGNLMVGAAEGLGGKLIRTVSFLGWTFPVSFLGGTAPMGAFGILGMFGLFSAINYLKQTKIDEQECQSLSRAGTHLSLACKFGRAKLSR
jgi:hypothetical protein